jgi:hypothetical protein
MEVKMPLPEALQYKPSKEFIESLQQLNNGLVEAGQRASSPMTANAALTDLTLPLFNLMAQYLKLSQQDTYGYFLGMFQFLYEQQQATANDNIILAVDPELAEEVSLTADAAIKVIRDTQSFIETIQDYLKANKPAPYEGDDKEELALRTSKIETHTSLREEALQISRGLQTTIDDLDAMATSVDQCVYEQEEEEEEPPAEPKPDEVALPLDEPPAEVYQSIIGE